MAISGVSVVPDSLGRLAAVPPEVLVDGRLVPQLNNRQQDIRIAAATPAPITPAPLPPESPLPQPESRQLLNLPEDTNPLREQILAAQRAVSRTQADSENALNAIATRTDNRPIAEVLGELNSLAETLENDRRRTAGEIANEPNARVFERVIINPGVVLDGPAPNEFERDEGAGEISPRTDAFNLPRRS